MARVAVFGPHPLLSITIEARGAGDDIHLHPGGQGVWVGRMIAELGAEPVLCGFIGGETGVVLEGLLDRLPGERRLTATREPSGCLLDDRREGTRRLVAQAMAAPPSRHELDALVGATVAAALGAGILVICNALPGDALPNEVYGTLAADAAANGCRVLVDLSSPRLDTVLGSRPELVKLNDWELAEYVGGPVEPPTQLLAAARRLRAAGARSVLVTRGEQPALWLDGDDAPLLIVPPRFDRGMPEGCGDSMMGAIAAALAQRRSLRDAVILGAAAGASNFLHTGLGTGERATIEALVPQVRVEPYPAA